MSDENFHPVYVEYLELAERRKLYRPHLISVVWILFKLQVTHDPIL